MKHFFPLIPIGCRLLVLKRLKNNRRDALSIQVEQSGKEINIDQSETGHQHSSFFFR